MAVPRQIRLRGATFDYRIGLAGEIAKPTDGGAKWDEIERSEDVSLTDYTGDALVKLDVPVLFNGWLARRNVEAEVNRVVALSQGGPAGHPPAFVATGPFPFSGLRCVMAMPDWGDAMRTADGVLVRQEMTLKLIEFQNPAGLTVRRRGGPGSSSSKQKKLATTMAKPHENLLMVSTRLFGTPKLAKKIGQLNGLRDVRKKFKKATRLRVPLPVDLTVG
jgi:hypothetical protein